MELSLLENCLFWGSHVNVPPVRHNTALMKHIQEWEK